MNSITEIQHKTALKTNSIYPLHWNKFQRVTIKEYFNCVYVLIITFVLLSRSSLESPIADCVPGRITTRQKCHNTKTQQFTWKWLTFSLSSTYLSVSLVIYKIMYLIIGAIYICMIGTEITSILHTMHYTASVELFYDSWNMNPSISKVIILIKEVLKYVLLSLCWQVHCINIYHIKSRGIVTYR